MGAAYGKPEPAYAFVQGPGWSRAGLDQALMHLVLTSSLAWGAGQLLLLLQVLSVAAPSHRNRWLRGDGAVCAQLGGTPKAPRAKLEVTPDSHQDWQNLAYQNQAGPAGPQACAGQTPALPRNTLRWKSEL